jgi:hypothetical protein
MPPSSTCYHSQSVPSSDDDAEHAQVSETYESIPTPEPNRKADDGPSCGLESDLGSGGGIFLAPMSRPYEDASRVLQSE